MTHWARQARNKAMNAKKKTKKREAQGEAMISLLRRVNGAYREREDQVSPDNSMEASQTGDGQESR